MLSIRTLARFVFALAALAALAAVLAPQIPADRYRGKVETGLERALRRNVEIGELRFTLWGGPGFTLRDVVIADSPEISAEPFAYVGLARARIALASIWRGELTFSRITLDQPSVNVARGADGVWNFEQMLRSGVGAGSHAEGELPELRVRNGRINFRNGLRKSIYYFRNADLQLAEEARGTGAWLLEFRAEPARTDSFAPRFGTVRGRGRWSPAAGKNGEMEADLEMERSPLAEVASLFRAPRAGLSGFLAARAHLSGPADALDIRGNLELSQRGDGGIFAAAGDAARVPLSGLLNLPARRMHLELSPAAGATSKSTAEPPENETPASPPAAPLPPVFEATVDYNQDSAPGEWLSRVVFSAMPVAQVTGLLQYLDDSFPDYPQLEGDLHGEVVYGSQGGLRGTVEAERLLWKLEPVFALRSLNLRLEGDRTEGSGLLDAEPVPGEGEDAEPAASPEATSSPAEAAKTSAPEYPSFGFDLNRQSGGLTVSVKGRKLTPEHLNVIARLAPVEMERPALLQGDGWEASGDVVWRRAGFRDAGVWRGQLLVHNLSVAVNGLASPVEFRAAPLELRGAAWRLKGALAKVGEVSVKIDATHSAPGARSAGFSGRDVSLKLSFDELSLAQVAREVTVRTADSRGILRRTFAPGVPEPPAWMRARSLLAKINIKKVLIEDSKYYNLQGDLYWDGTSPEFRNISVESRFGLLQAQIGLNLESETPQWSWTAIGRNLPWHSGDLEIREDFSATGTPDSMLSRMEGRSEIVWRRPPSPEWPSPSMTRVALKWLPGAEEPFLCAECVEFRSGLEVYAGGCERGNGTSYHCLLQDPRTGQEHTINLPISLFGTGAK